MALELPTVLRMSVAKNRMTRKGREESMKNWTKLGTVACLAVLLNGCAHARLERQIDNKVAQEDGVKTHADLVSEGAELIKTAQGLTSDQRQRLTKLKVDTEGQLDPLRNQSLKLRAVLIQDLLSSPYNEDEVELIKERLSSIEDRRLNIMFSAVTQANQILGRQSLANHTIVEGFIEGHGNRE